MNRIELELIKGLLEVLKRKCKTGELYEQVLIGIEILDREIEEESQK